MRFSSFEEMLAHWAARTPDAPALRYEERCWSFAELNRAVSERAEALRSEGGSCLGLLSDGSAECVIELFAAVRAGLRMVLDAAPDVHVVGEASDGAAAANTADSASVTKNSAAFTVPTVSGTSLPRRR